jgi:AraC family transcriptional regulator
MVKYPEKTFLTDISMQKPGDLLEYVLNEIEKRIKEDVNADLLAADLGISSVHLQRLFKFAFERTLGSYIRSRKLTASLDHLLNTDSKVVSIAVEYGFEYEQSYIRTFKREFGITPGDLRKTGQIVKIKPPLHLLDENKLEDSVFFGPDIVMVPQFHIIGRDHQIIHDFSINHASELITHFWENDRKLIKNLINPDIFICLIHNINWEEQHSVYTTAVQVENIKNVPQGLNSNTFNTSMCARFRYIGQQPYSLDIHKYFVYRMYNSIKEYVKNKQLEYILFKTDTRLYSQNYYQIELFTPVSEKQ